MKVQVRDCVQGLFDESKPIELVSSTQEAEKTVVERKVNDNLSIADQDSKDTYYDSDQFAEENIEQDQDFMSQ